jgi:hypothetical protein
MSSIDANDPLRGEAYFQEMLSKFQTGLDLAMRFSARCDGVRVEQRHGWASWLFLRLCIVGQSLDRLATFRTRLDEGEVYTLDHNSIAAITRNIIEATLMFFYVSEPGVDDDEWGLRKDVLDLHDCLTRYRLFKSWKSEKEMTSFRESAAHIKERIRNHKLMKTFDAEKRKQLLGGQQLYLNGLRSVVKRAGWDPDRFDGVYAYLSVHSHSAPTSFYRTDTHHIDFSKPSEYQFGLAGFALEHADQSIRAASKRLIEVFPHLFPEINTSK